MVTVNCAPSWCSMSHAYAKAFQVETNDPSTQEVESNLLPPPHRIHRFF